MDTEVHVQKEENVKIQGECQVQIGPMMPQTKELSDANGETWNQSFPVAFRRGMTFLTY